MFKEIFLNEKKDILKWEKLGNEYQLKDNYGNVLALIEIQATSHNNQKNSYEVQAIGKIKFKKFIKIQDAKKYVLDEIQMFNEDSQITEKIKAKAFIGTAQKKNWAVKLEGFDATLIDGGGFTAIMDLKRFITPFKESAKKTHIDSKGKATISAVKAWVKENKPSEFYAKWTPDSSFYKDDSVEIYYN